MKTLEIIREGTEHEKQFCNDSAFYTWTENHTLTATVVFGEREIRVFCDGEMRIHIWDSKEAREINPHVYDVIRYCDHLSSVGITTDEELRKADEAGRIEWINNSWFDLYAYGEGIEDGWLDAVSHDLNEAILQASELIESNEFWKEVK